MGRLNLADFEASAVDTARQYGQAKRIGSKMPYDDPQAVLRRCVYRYAQAYADADMAPDLKGYVEDRTDPARGLKADDAFVWFIRLITLVHRRPALASVSQSTWSKMAPVLALAHRLGVDYRYLEPFIYMGGRMDGIVMNIDPNRPPGWLEGLTRPVQERGRSPRRS